MQAGVSKPPAVQDVQVHPARTDWASVSAAKQMCMHWFAEATSCPFNPSCPDLLTAARVSAGAHIEVQGEDSLTALGPVARWVFSDSSFPTLCTLCTRVHDVRALWQCALKPVQGRQLRASDSSICQTCRNPHWHCQQCCTGDTSSLGTCSLTP